VITSSSTLTKGVDSLKSATNTLSSKFNTTTVSALLATFKLNLDLTTQLKNLSGNPEPVVLAVMPPTAPEMYAPHY